MALYTVGSGTALAAQDINQLVNLLTGVDTSTAVTINNRIQAITPDAAFPSGYVGGTTGGAPGSGTFLAGDFIVDRLGFMWVCAVAGSPGTWYRQGGGNYACVATQANGQTLTARTGQTGFDTMNLDFTQDANSDPHSMFSSGGHSITVPLAGYYLITGVVTTSTGSATAFDQASIIVKNGSAVSRGTEVSVKFGGSTAVADVVSCAASDVIKLGVYAELAASVATGTGSIMLSVCLVT